MTIEHDVHTNVLLEPHSVCFHNKNMSLTRMTRPHHVCENWYILELFSEPYLECMVAQSKQVMFCFSCSTDCYAPCLGFRTMVGARHCNFEQDNLLFANGIHVQGF